MDVASTSNPPSSVQLLPSIILWLGEHIVDSQSDFVSVARSSVYLPGAIRSTLLYSRFFFSSGTGTELGNLNHSHRGIWFPRLSPWRLWTSPSVRSRMAHQSPGSQPASQPSDPEAIVSLLSPLSSYYLAHQTTLRRRHASSENQFGDIFAHRWISKVNYSAAKQMSSWSGPEPGLNLGLTKTQRQRTERYANILGRSFPSSLLLHLITDDTNES